MQGLWVQSLVRELRTHMPCGVAQGERKIPNKHPPNILYFQNHITSFSLYPPYRQCSSVQSLSHVRLFATPWTAARQPSLSITNSWSLLKLMSTESVMLSNHLILCRYLLLCLQWFPAPGSFPRSQFFTSGGQSIGVLVSASAPSNEYLGLISFTINWLDFLAVQGTLKSLLQHHSSKASIFQHSAFFPVQLSDPYMTTGKTIALTRGTFVGKVMSLLFNMLSRLVITFLQFLTPCQSGQAIIFLRVKS